MTPLSNNTDILKWAGIEVKSLEQKQEEAAIALKALKQLHAELLPLVKIDNQMLRHSYERILGEINWQIHNLERDLAC